MLHAALSGLRSPAHEVQFFSDAVAVSRMHVAATRAVCGWHGKPGMECIYYVIKVKQVYII
jgi:hypothetical protein